VFLPHEKDAAGGLGSFHADDGDATEEEGEPAFPIAMIANGLKAFVILRAIFFEEVRKVEDGLGQNVALAEEESDEQATHAAIAIQKRVDGLKLGMCQADLDELRQVAV
jgi:hypothetical protein